MEVIDSEEEFSMSRGFDHATTLETGDMFEPVPGAQALLNLELDSTRGYVEADAEVRRFTPSQLHPPAAVRLKTPSPNAPPTATEPTGLQSFSRPDVAASPLPGDEAEADADAEVEAADDDDDDVLIHYTDLADLPHGPVPSAGSGNSTGHSGSAGHIAFLVSGPTPTTSGTHPPPTTSSALPTPTKTQLKDKRIDGGVSLPQDSRAPPSAPIAKKRAVVIHATDVQEALNPRRPSRETTPPAPSSPPQRREEEEEGGTTMEDIEALMSSSSPLAGLLLSGIPRRPGSSCSPQWGSLSTGPGGRYHSPLSGIAAALSMSGSFEQDSIMPMDKYPNQGF